MLLHNRQLAQRAVPPPAQAPYLRTRVTAALHAQAPSRLRLNPIFHWLSILSPILFYPIPLQVLILIFLLYISHSDRNYSRIWDIPEVGERACLGLRCRASGRQGSPCHGPRDSKCDVTSARTWAKAWQFVFISIRQLQDLIRVCCNIHSSRNSAKTANYRQSIGYLGQDPFEHGPFWNLESKRSPVAMDESSQEANNR